MLRRDISTPGPPNRLGRETVATGRRRHFKSGLVVFLPLLFLGPSFGAEPVLKEMKPLGAQRGTTFTLTLKGEGLVVGTDLVTTFPATISKLAPPKDLENPNTQLSFLVQLAEEAPVGLYPLRVHTDDGLSNLMIFSVGDFPEISENPPNKSLSAAQPVTPPVAIDGNVKGRDEDYYRFAAQARERLVFEVEARRIGSAVDPVVEVLDSRGRRVAYNDDAPGLGVDSRLEVTFSKAGTYYALVHDSKYSQQETGHYRLKIGSYAYADGIFPLGGQRGKTVDVTFLGGNLEKPLRRRVDLNVPPQTQYVPVNLPGARPVGSLPFYLLVGDGPEAMAPVDGSVARLDPSTLINGRITKPGQVDRYKLKVSAGQKWTFNLWAQSLGTSQLYGAITVSDSLGKALKTTQLGAGPDARIAFTVPDRVDEVTLAVSDVRGLGGPAYGYRLCAVPGDEDFELKVRTPYLNVPAHGTAAVEIVAERHNYQGPIQLSIPDLPGDFVMAGGNIASAVLDFYEGRVESSTVGYLTLTAKPEAKPRVLQLSVWGQAVPGPGNPSGISLRRRAEGPGIIFRVAGEELVNLTGDVFPSKPVTYPTLGIDLPVSLGEPSPVTLEVSAQNVRAVQGIEYAVSYKVVKQAAGVVTTSVSALPPPSIKGLEFGSDNKPENKDQPKNPDEGKILVNSMVDTPLVKLDVVPVANLQVNGKEEVVVAPAFTVELVRAYSLALANDRVELKNGAKVEFTGTVHREPIFAEAIKIRIADPPDRVTCAPIEVPKDKSEFRLECEASPAAEVGDFEVHLVSSAANPGHVDKRDCTAPPVTAHMVVAAENPAQTAANKAAR
jgi:hypothetical protein